MKNFFKCLGFYFCKTFTGAWGNGGTTMKNFKINEKILLNQINNIKRILPRKNYNLKYK